MGGDELQELQEHAEHAKHDPSMTPISLTMAVLAVVVAGIGSSSSAREKGQNASSATTNAMTRSGRFTPIGRSVFGTCRDSLRFASRLNKSFTTPRDGCSPFSRQACPARRISDISRRCGKHARRLHVTWKPVPDEWLRISDDVPPLPVFRERAGVRVLSSTNDIRKPKSPSPRPSPGVPGEGVTDAHFDCFIAAPHPSPRSRPARGQFSRNSS